MNIKYILNNIKKVLLKYFGNENWELENNKTISWKE